MERGQRCDEGGRRRDIPGTGNEEWEVATTGGSSERGMGVGVKGHGTVEPSLGPQAPFNKTRLMQLIDHLGMH